MKLGVSLLPNMRRLMRDQYLDGERAVTTAMQGASRALKTDWRGQIVAAGLGRRLGNTVRSAAYPQGTVSMDAAALVWTKAPKIIAAHDEGAVIHAVNRRWLAIPLPAAGEVLPGRQAVTPEALARSRGLQLRFVATRGGYFLVGEGRLTKKRQGRAKKRLKSGRYGKGAATIFFFQLVPQVRLTKKTDLEGGALNVADGLPSRIVALMEN